MTVDERLEALTMNLELMSHSAEANARHIEAHDRQIEANARQIEKLTDAVTKLVGVSNEDATAIRTLARIADLHEKRVTGIEGGRA